MKKWSRIASAKETPRAALDERNATILSHAATGLNAAEIAREVGVSRGVVWHVLSAHGTRPHPEPRIRSIADVVADMMRLDAVKYLIAAYDDLAGRTDATVAEVFAYGLAPAEANIFGILSRHQGRMVPVRMIEAALDAERDADRVVGRHLIYVHVSRLRRKLRGTPWRLVNVFGYGYRLDAETQSSVSAIDGSAAAMKGTRSGTV
ncbi:helix-turn-helix domain-containing protein [Paracoccus spongiarum]|uniref:Helix-turn-helix domain-containing protein n=1 Tax=Paracoccus spongiarum TaxID=3064387 RepID=A0ABT9JH57_9RHOB|nr:helix-turn-helix domain-containing protein [Paracoccus sp. 2205BS29-5]MDP5309149.1 helix-turn-helix domain-containing protein [Paracoccus sp. 2205BS29-5]